VFQNSGGYDGQSYHYVAHDPLDRTDIGRAVPDPSRRYPLFLGLGAYWLAQLLAQLLARTGGHPLFAALYFAVPVAIISLDRMLVDLTLASLGLGFAVYMDRDSPWKLHTAQAAPVTLTASRLGLLHVVPGDGELRGRHRRNAGDTATEGMHHADYGEAQKREQQGIFDQILAAVVLQKSAEQYSHLGLSVAPESTGRKLSPVNREKLS
jgi:hypothetical protein